jgi:hypothetical protein
MDFEWYEEIDAPELAAVLQGRCAVTVPNLLHGGDGVMVGYSLHRGHLYADVETGPTPGMVTFLRHGTPRPLPWRR